MSEYTPTTIEILEAYRSARFTERGIRLNRSSFEFDRWLSQMKADAVAEFIGEEIKWLRQETHE